MENEIKFPDYCCFGKLISSSISETANEITADYQMSGSVVHKLTYSKDHDSWQIKDQSSDGNNPRVSGGKTMGKAICIHMMSIDCKTDELFRRLQDELFKLGKVWFNPLPERGKGTHLCHSPAGLMIQIRLLLTERGDIEAKMNKLKELPATIGSECKSNLEPLTSYATYCVINKKESKSVIIRASITEFLLPLAFVYDAAVWLTTNCNLWGDRIDRIIMESASPGEIGIQGFYFGESEKTDETGFIVIMKGFLKSKEEFARQLDLMKEKCVE